MFSPIYSKILKRNIEETLEKEVAFEPEVTGEIFKEKMQAEALEVQEQETEQKSASKMVLRPRKKVDYTKVEIFFLFDFRKFILHSTSVNLRGN